MESIIQAIVTIREVNRLQRMAGYSRVRAEFWNK